MKANKSTPPDPQAATIPETPLRTKIGYIGTGIMVGVIIYPFVRKALAKAQPNLDKLFDSLTGKAEGLAEMASDLLAKAKQGLADQDVKSDHQKKYDTANNCDHSHEH